MLCRCRTEAEPAVVTIAGVDRPVTAALALCESIPRGGAGGVGRSAEADDRNRGGAGDDSGRRDLLGDLARSTVAAMFGLLRRAGHAVSVPLVACGVSCRVRARGLPGRVHGFTPRTPTNPVPSVVPPSPPYWCSRGCGWRRAELGETVRSHLRRDRRRHRGTIRRYSFVSKPDGESCHLPFGRGVCFTG